ncbi:hypothetical protein PoB_005168900 [Plakobranchus ocellatus]|uniref:Uncharacterized protein n=1 Tax=Plakobranchus ocellatus TaxID=259542 RepID=A0AAV4C3C0_9GAST|nr:hypothetical protein PoB_005168900 [Plakobranchus ocellatus]
MARISSALRASVNRATGYTPNRLMLGREVNTPLELFARPQTVQPIGDEPLVNTYLSHQIDDIQHVYSQARDTEMYPTKAGELSQLAHLFSKFFKSCAERSGHPRNHEWNCPFPDTCEACRPCCCHYSGSHHFDTRHALGSTCERSVQDARLLLGSRLLTHTPLRCLFHSSFAQSVASLISKGRVNSTCC